MNADRWRKVDQVFHDALEYDAPGRALFLDRACHGDSSLRREVDALIDAYERVGSFLSAPLNGEGHEVPDPTNHSGESSAASGAIAEGRFPSGTILAQRYRIITLLGRGGMGEVYRSHDLLLGQQVALKSYLLRGL